MLRKLGIVVMVVLALALTACTSSVSPTTTVPTTTRQLPAVDLSATPTGWVQVAYGDAQVSVPASFAVLYSGELECMSGPLRGALFVAPTPIIASMPGDCFPRNDTYMSLLAMRHLPSTYVGEKPILINGVPVYIGATGDYYAPALEVEVKVNGPLAKRLLGSLTRSPRAVVLDSGSAPAVPSSWQTVTFAGVRFSVPGDWPIDQTSFVRVGLGNPCALEPGLAFTNKGSTLLTGGVTLTSDQHLLPPPACASMRYITAQVPMDGVQADSGRSVHFRVTLSFAKHCLRLRGLTACPATSPAFSILVLWVKVPARSVGVFVSLGLAGNGMVARTILYSLKEA